MVTRRTAFGAGSAGLTILGVGAYALLKPAEPKVCFVPSDFPALYSVRFTEENAAANVSSHSSSNASAGLAGQAAQKGEFEGTLTLVPEAGTTHIAQGKGAKETVLMGRFEAGALRNAQGEHTQFKSFQKPFAVVFNENCHIAAVESDGRESRSSRSMVHRLVALFDLGLVLSKANPESAPREDEFGRSTFAVAMAESQSPEKLVVFRQSVLAEPGERTSGAFVVQEILDSQFTFVRPPSKTLPEQVDVTESFEGFHKDNNETRRLTYSVSLKRIVGAAAATRVRTIQDGRLSEDSLYRVSKRPETAYRSVDKATAYDEGNDAAVLAQTPVRTYEDAREQFLERMAEDPTGAKRLLLAYLRANPDAVVALKNDLAADAFEPELLADLVFVFAKVGTAEAQAMMGELFNDDNLSINLRLRLVFAAADIPAPTPEIVAALKEQTDALKSAKEPIGDLNSSAYLALGNVGKNARDVTPSVEDSVREELLESLEKAPNETQRANVLDAVGNFGDPALIPEVEPYLKSASAAERSAALEAFSRIPSPVSERKVATALSTESDPWVKSYAVRSLRTLGVSSNETVEALTQSYLSLREPQTRIDAIEALGQSKNNVPSARSALGKVVENETDARVIEAAGRHLSAQEMSELLAKRRSGSGAQ